MVANLLPTWGPRRARTGPGAAQEPSGGGSRMEPILGPVLRAPSRSSGVGPAECAGPGGDYRGGAGSWLKVKVLSVEGF